MFNFQINCKQIIIISYIVICLPINDFFFEQDFYLKKTLVLQRSSSLLYWLNDYLLFKCTYL